MKRLLALALTSALFLTACQKNSAVNSPSASPQAVVLETLPSKPASDQLKAKFVLGDLAADRPQGISLVADHSGKADSAFSFPGGTAGLSAPLNINPDVMPQCTLVTWAKFTGDIAAGGIQQVVSHDDGAYDRSMGLDSRAGQWGWSCFAGNKAVIGGIPVEPGAWTFMATVYDQSTKTLVFYVGDKQIAAKEVELGQGLEAISLGTNPTHGEFFQGQIEPVRIFDRALSYEEIQSLRQQ